MQIAALLFWIASVTIVGQPPPRHCTSKSFTLQVLGSGGPGINPDRASASYLLWIDGKAKVLIDAGGGSFLRFGQTQARLNDLTLIGISHLHPDHVSDLPAMLWSPESRTEPLAIAGPSGNALMPDFATFLTRLFDAKAGAFPVLGGWLGAAGLRGVRLEVVVIDTGTPEPTTVYAGGGTKITAIGVPHKCCPAPDIPALAYRVEAQKRTVVFAGDQNGSDPRFVDFAHGADVLVMHLTISGPRSDAGHASPAVIGQIARDARVGRLVLGHIGRFDSFERAIADVKRFYTGPLTVGSDLQCSPVP